jgi:hypothetical protein
MNRQATYRFAADSSPTSSSEGRLKGSYEMRLEEPGIEDAGRAIGNFLILQDACHTRLSLAYSSMDIPWNFMHYRWLQRVTLVNGKTRETYMYLSIDSFHNTL